MGSLRDIHWLANYVMLSRATSLDALLILRLCTRDELTAGAPRFLLKEVDRLLAVEKKSWAKLQKCLERLLPDLSVESQEVIRELFQDGDTGAKAMTAPHRCLRPRQHGKHCK